MATKSLVYIDKDKLDEVVFTHADRYLEYAEQLEEARHGVEVAEAKLDVVKAEVEKEIRKFPKRFKLKLPIREASIKLEIVLHPRYQKFESRLIEKKHRRGILQAAVNALDHRKRMIEKGCDLFFAGYFGKPRVDPDEQAVLDYNRKKRLKKRRDRDDLD